MGGFLSCLSNNEVAKGSAVRRLQSGIEQHAATAAVIGSSVRWGKGRRRNSTEDALLQEALEQLLLQQSDEVRASTPLHRSSSVRPPLFGHMNHQGVPRSTSSRARSLAHPVASSPELVNQQIKVGDLETNKVVLVHGGGFGAWCWYKTIAHLENDGFEVNAIDLTGSGVHSSDPNDITSLPQYVKPLISFLEKLGDAEKVILIGHDFGGACISYAMEAFPAKIFKAIFLAAAMLESGQSTLEMFSKMEGTNNLMQQAQNFLYANGKDQTPTAIEFDKSSLKDLLFNQSPLKDIALASVSMRPIPFAPVLEKLVLTDAGYGSVRRFYIETSEDNAISLPLQESMCESFPPEKVFRLKGSDHSPFFSKPQALHKILVEIASIPPI